MVHKRLARHQERLQELGWEALELPLEAIEEKKIV
jgi:hypothetical protein